MKKMTYIQAFIGLAALVALGGCGAETSGGAKQDPNQTDVFSRDILPVMQTSCSGGSCHSAGSDANSAAGFSISTVDATYASLFSKPVVVKGNAAASPLYASVTQRNMPIGRAKEPFATIVKDWINAGAPRFSSAPPPKVDLLPPIDTSKLPEEAAFVKSWQLGPMADYAVKIVDATNLIPGQSPKVEFSVFNPKDNTPYTDLDSTGSTLWPTTGTPTTNIEILVSWTTDDYTTVGNAMRVRLSDRSRAGVWTYNPVTKTYTVDFSKLSSSAVRKIAANATGSVGVSVGGRQKATVTHPVPDTDTTITEAVAVPIVNEVKYYGLNGAKAVPRREIADAARCARCHTLLAGHGSSRSGNIATCVMCHTGNNTDTSRRTFAVKIDPDLDGTFQTSFNAHVVDPAAGIIRVNIDTDLNGTADSWVNLTLLPTDTGTVTKDIDWDVDGTVDQQASFTASQAIALDGLYEQTIDFKYMIHAIHAGSDSDSSSNGMRKVPYMAAGAEFGWLYFPAKLADCEICHLPGTYTIPFRGTLGTATNTDPERDGTINPEAEYKRMTPEASSCFSCHDDPAVMARMNIVGGGKTDVTTAQMGFEACSVCHRYKAGEPHTKL